MPCLLWKATVFRRAKDIRSSVSDGNLVIVEAMTPEGPRTQLRARLECAFYNITPLRNWADLVERPWLYFGV